MHALSILKVVGLLMTLVGLAQFVPALTSAWYGDADWNGFVESAALTTLAGGVLFLLTRKSRELSIRDGFAVVSAAWVTVCAAGALPFYLTGALPDFVDALFESTSGFTTTGASVIVDYDTVSHGIFMWRSLSHWLGGMGIILLALAIFPALGMAGMQLYERESSGVYHDKLTPRLRDTAKALWLSYVVITAAQIAALTALGMPLFDAVNHTMATVATGGFGTKGDSIGSYGPAIEWVIIFFMFISGMNFALHFRFLVSPFKRSPYLRDIELRWYAIAMAACSLAVSGYLYLSKDYAPGPALTKGTFQVVSIMSTTGFASDDYVKWGAFPQIILLLCMITGACAGSTCGAVKWIRIVLLAQNARMSMLRLIHPNVVRRPKINDVAVTDEIQSNVGGFVFLYFVSLAVLTLIVSMDGQSFLTALGAAAACQGGVGPGFDLVGPAGNYSTLSPYVKYALTVGMLLGRLELVTLLMMVNPRLWRG